MTGPGSSMTPDAASTSGNTSRSGSWKRSWPALSRCTAGVTALAASAVSMVPIRKTRAPAARAFASSVATTKRPSEKKRSRTGSGWNTRPGTSGGGVGEWPRKNPASSGSGSVTLV